MQEGIRSARVDASQRQCVCAFVTFKTEEARLKCMQANPSSRGAARHACLIPKKAPKNSYLLTSQMLLSMTFMRPCGQANVVLSRGQQRVCVHAGKRWAQRRDRRFRYMPAPASASGIGLTVTHGAADALDSSCCDRVLHNSSLY